MPSPVYLADLSGVSDEKYRIVPGTGNLHVLDANGTVGFAVEFNQASPFVCKAQRR